MSTRDRVRALLAEVADAPATDAAPLTIDSLGLVQLVESLEDAFAMRVAAKEVTRENFGSVDTIVAFVETKT